MGYDVPRVMSTKKSKISQGTRDAYITKVRVQSERRERFERAYIAHRSKRGRSDMRFTDWVRLALEAQADRDLG